MTTLAPEHTDTCPLAERDVACTFDQCKAPAGTDCWMPGNHVPGASHIGRTRALRADQAEWRKAHPQAAAA